MLRLAKKTYSPLSKTVKSRQLRNVDGLGNEDVSEHNQTAEEDSCDDSSSCTDDSFDSDDIASEQTTFSDESGSESNDSDSEKSGSSVEEATIASTRTPINMQKALFPGYYNGPCDFLAEELLHIKEEEESARAIFVPTSNFNLFRKIMRKRKVYVFLKWDYDLQIGGILEQMKLVWTNGKIPQEIATRFKIKAAFSFLQPHFLQFMHSRFWNPNAITVACLVLDLHRTQKRETGIEIFNICDLIKFKMALDDNRYEYENCEFHKLIEQEIAEIKRNGKYTKNSKKLFLNEYLIDKQEFEPIQYEVLDYLTYHFQKTIRYLGWYNTNATAVRLSRITNIPEFLLSTENSVIYLRDTDPSGKCAKVLYEILANCEEFRRFRFELDGRWYYNWDTLVLNEYALPNCHIEIKSKNSFGFVENFIYWLKHAFGERCKFINLSILSCDTIKPFVFNELHLQQLEFKHMQLDYKLIRMLSKCHYEEISFHECGIANDEQERFDLISQKLGNSQNIFKYLDDLSKVKIIYLTYDNNNHILGTLFSYIESIMMKDNLMEFKPKNQYALKVGNRSYAFYGDFKFVRFHVNCNLDQIQAYFRGKWFDFNEHLNILPPDGQPQYEVE